MRTLCWTLGGALLLATPAAAQVNTFTDRATWLAAAGTPSAQEDFSGFGVDTPFNPPPVTVTTAVGTLGETGLTQNFRNFVETPPFQFTDNNGTNHASCFTNSPDAGPGSETEVQIVLAMPATAFGADFVGVRGGEFLTIEAIEAGTGIVLASILAPAQNTFMGFVATGGEQIGSIVLRSTNTNPGGAGEGFAMDDLAVVFAAAAVPALTPVALVVLVLLIAGMGSLYLRRGATAGAER